MAIFPATGEQGGAPDFLINGMFLPPDRQLELVKRLNLERGWDFTEADFEQLGLPPMWPTDNPLAVVVLNISLVDVAITFETAWNCITSVQPNQWRWDKFLSGPEQLRLLSGKTHQRGLRWQIVNLGANTNRKPIDVRTTVTSPSSAILWMAFYSSKWVQAMDGSTIPYVCLPGYEVSFPDERRWIFVPNLRWLRIYRRVELNASLVDMSYGDWAVPALWEPIR